MFFDICFTVSKKGCLQMNQYIIGLPRALLYYRYHDLWKTFFEELGCKVVISEPSNQQILENGIKHSIDETCLSLKLYLGHVQSLKNRCDYVLVPRIICLKKHEKLCTNFNALYDIVHNTFPKIPLLNYNIDVSKKETEFFAFLKMGRELGFSYLDSIRSYQKAKKVEQKKRKRKIEQQEKQLNSNKTKILLVSHAYNLYDPLIGESIITYLKKQGIEVILADIYDTKKLKEEAKMISRSNYWTYNKELLGALTHYKNQVDGIILLSTFPCGPDSLTNEMCLRKVHNVPLIHLIIDELKAEAGILTRLESFLDIIDEKKKRSQQHEIRKNH